MTNREVARVSEHVFGISFNPLASLLYGSKHYLLMYTVVSFNAASLVTLVLWRTISLCFGLLLYLVFLLALCQPVYCI